MKLLTMAVCAAMAGAVLAGADEDGFVSIFNGRDLAGWTGDANAYYVSEPGVLACGPREVRAALKPDDALMTEKEYADFVLRFECKIESGADNGIGIRYPGVDDMAYSGIEMQLADTAKTTQRKDTWRTTGGFYGVSYALDDRKPGQDVIGGTYVKPCGEWNAVELRAEGSRLTAWLNGVKVNECDLAERDPKTGFDKHPHSGVRAKRGRFVFWVGNPRKTVWWRNLRVKELKSAAEVEPNARRFLYSDFMNRKLVYVDESNPAAYWEAFLPEVSFDVTLAGLHRLYAAQTHGWREYGLNQMQFVREVKDAERMKAVTSVGEGTDGHVYALEQDGAVHEFTREGKWLRSFAFPKSVHHCRAMRFASDGVVLVGMDDGVAELRLDRASGKAEFVRTFKLPGAHYTFQAERLADGSTLVSGGYLPELVRFGADGQIVSRAKANQTDGLSDYFYAGFSRRAGKTLVANWTGHSGRDFRPGLKLLEFDAAGDVTWKWNAPWAGTPCSVIGF